MTDPVRSATPGKSGFRPLAQIGLRARIILSFALLAALISMVLIAASVVLSRGNLLDQREAQATSRARTNADTVTDKVGLPDTDAQALFGSLSTTGRPSVILRDQVTGDENAVSYDSKYGADAVPRSLVTRVLDDRKAGLIRYERDGEPLLAVGVPLTNRDGGYFEVTSLADIAGSVTSLTKLLAIVAVVTAIVGAALGLWASRRVLRPLTDISHVAEDIAVGKLDARLAYSEWADDPDLAPLVSSFNEMVAALQARIDRDARFASDVSHELRSPLTTFNASIEVLRNAREELPDRAQTALDLLSSDMERFTQLVEDLLEISRFDAGAVRLELDEVLIVDTVEIAVRTLSTRPIPVIAGDNLRDVIVLCDKRRLVRILANYIDNAAKYAEGAVLITVERIDDPDAEDPDTEPLGDRIRIAVEDAGPGVPEGDRGSIFDRFNRGTQGGSRGNDLGVGLGLALAAEHARLQGGDVWVEGRGDGEQGSRFVVEIPLLEPAEDDFGDALDSEPRLDTVIAPALINDRAAATAPAFPAPAGPRDVHDVVRTGEHRAISIDEPPPEDR